ncbi:MAG: c-type cytochrome [Pseudomonadota bacterium]
MKFFKRDNSLSPMASFAIPALSAVALIAISACAHNGHAADTPKAQNDAPAITGLDPAAIKRGKLVFLQCRACHALKANQGHKVGPNLAGLIGATIGDKDGFNYSAALTEATDQWTPEKLDSFLTKPSDYFEGTIMAFGGIGKPEDRAAVIAYLRAETAE